MNSLIALLLGAATSGSSAVTALPVAGTGPSADSDARTLDGYLAAPMRKVLGTRLAMNVTNPTRRAAPIAYLRTATAR